MDKTRVHVQFDVPPSKVMQRSEVLDIMQFKEQTMKDAKYN